MDETSLSTVQNGQRKILGHRGKKQIGALTSQERGESSTCVVWCSAAGNFIPPPHGDIQTQKNETGRPMVDPLGLCIHVKKRDGFLMKDLFHGLNILLTP